MLVLLMSGIIFSSCVGMTSIGSIQKFSFVDGKLFVLVWRSSKGFLSRVTELEVSTDLSLTWRRLEISNLVDFAFLNSREGFLVADDKVYKTVDGGNTRQLLFSPLEPVLKIQRLGTAVAGLTKRSLYLSYDSGANWRLFSPPLPAGGGVQISTVAAADDMLAVGDNRGNVFMSAMSSDTWTTWKISELVQELASHNGLFYAITSDWSGIKVLDGRSVKHIPTDTPLGLDGFASFATQLYCYGSHSIFRLSGPLQATKVLGPSDQLRVIKGLEMISEREAICAAPGAKWGVAGTLKRISLSPPQVSTLGAVP